MDSNRIKRLATGAREALRNEVSARLDVVLAEGSRESLEVSSQVRAIQKDIQAHGRDEVIDRAAYTWFNRLCALRFMDTNGYTPTPVVTPRPGSTQPAILADAAQGLFDPDYEVSQDVRQRVAGLLTGAIPSNNAAEDAYSLLLREVCRHYSEPMGYLFSEDVASSLLMPQGLLAQGSILSRIVSEMDEGACSDVEVLGWLYQFYIAERKDQVFAAYKKGKKAQAADIAPATQLFTPGWIVRYMAENSLGRLWMLNNPGSELAGSMEYYVAPEGDEPHIDISSADEIRVLDPACGSGHILIYAFDLLFRMYEEEGWPTEEIPQMILENNLFGLEIDRRAAEIASFALEMKARKLDPRWFERGVDAHIRVLEPVELLPQELELVPRLAERRGLLEAMSHLDEVGSLYVPDSLDEFVLTDELERVKCDGSLFTDSVIVKLKVMLANVRTLEQSYHCVIVNPPYMGSGNMNPWLSGWLKVAYPSEKADLCTCFISRGRMLTKSGGYLAMITASSWMFISSYEALRKSLIDGSTVLSMIQQSTHGYPNVTVPTTMFVLSNDKLSIAGSYIRLEDFDRPQWQQPRALQAIHNPECSWFYRTKMESFKAIPGWPIAYWASEALFKLFRSADSLGSLANVKKGMSTGENARFVRIWFEVNRGSFAANLNGHEASAIAHEKWVPYNKGGEFRKWYGNNREVLNWGQNGRELKSFSGAVLRNQQYYFKPCVTWSALSSGRINFRFKQAGSIHDGAGASFFERTISLFYLMAALNSSSIMKVAEILSPTLNFEIGQVSSYPVPIPDPVVFDKVENLSKTNVQIVKKDWDAFETSWDFVRHPMARVNAEGPTLLADAYARWESECRGRFDSLRSNEEELNRTFARIYRMEGEVPIEVPDDKVSVRLADRARDARSLISYAVGCLFGRYSDEADGLVLADQGTMVDDFRTKVPDATFLPDSDNVLPVLADEWFDDDVVAGIRLVRRRRRGGYSPMARPRLRRGGARGERHVARGVARQGPPHLLGEGLLRRPPQGVPEAPHLLDVPEPQEELPVPRLHAPL